MSIVPLTAVPAASRTTLTITSATARAELLTGGTSLAGSSTARKICVSAVCAAVCAESKALKSTQTARHFMKRSYNDYLTATVIPRNVPWYVWCSVAAVTCAMTGTHWDISWHRSIGRDTFWTPAHVDIYLCGVLTGIVSAYLILSTTFDRNSPL